MAQANHSRPEINKSYQKKKTRDESRSRNLVYLKIKQFTKKKNKREWGPQIII